MRLLRLASLTLALSGAGCATGAFETARQTDTADAYRKFLREHPGDDLAEAAEARLEEVAFADAKKLHTLVAYKRFLEEFPKAAQVRDAKTLLEGLRFNAALAAGTTEALLLFLREHPDGTQREAATAKLEELTREKLATGTPEEKQKLTALHPDDPRAEAFVQQADQNAFAAAVRAGPKALYGYLDQNPNGRYRLDAQARLFGYRIDALLASGLSKPAREEWDRSPLKGRLPEVSTRIDAATAAELELSRAGPLVAAARAEFYLRPLEELKATLGSADPQDRWEAADELGHHVSVLALDALQDVVVQSRHPLVRLRAAASLRRILRALPRPVGEYESATRLRAVRTRAASNELLVLEGLLLDVGGDVAGAGQAFAKAHDAKNPDPLLLSRWSELREERGQHFSAAVAARQLSLWARTLAEDSSAEDVRASPLTEARSLCAAVAVAREAEATVKRARERSKEFPEDLVAFTSQAAAATRIAEVRLEEAELRLAALHTASRPCADGTLATRLQASLTERQAALRQVPTSLPKLAPLLLQVARDRDPAPEVRTLAQSLLTP